ELIAEALRESGIPHRVRGGSGILERPAVRKALRELRAADVPLGTALVDLELGLEVELEEGATDERAEDDRAAVALVVQMGRDYLRLDPLGGAATFAAWLAATVQSETDSVTGGDAVDVATFHAAKGLEWGIVHLAGVEDGYVPIAHARTAAAKAEEARLLYVAMTRAQRELHISWAEHRTFGGRVVDRRRSPLLEPVPDRREVDAEEPAAPTPPVEDWAEELVRQRGQLERTRRRSSPELDALRRWRDGVARAARVAPEAVLADHVLARIVEARPRHIDDLGEIRGVGTILAGRFGPDLLATLRAAEPGAVGR
ncbi:MAG TPA: 3'-5' exonuclease, partial [Acidimicrobiales bacterium]|nr:3'-5' exonuclease [Acidimicrobiales bacterium]